MNKFLTLLMVALLGISSIATAQDITKDDAFKQLMQAGVKQTKAPEKQSAAATYAMPTRTAQTAAKAATAEPVELYFDSFYSDPIYYEAGDWYIVLRNDRYQFIFDIFGGTPEDPSGTYTEEDLDIWFSWCMFPEANGDTHYYKTCDLTVQRKQLSANKVKYILEAEVLATCGIGGPEYGRFKIYAEHETIIPSQVIETAFRNVQITPEADRFSIDAKNDSMSLDMTLFSDFGVQGYYSENSIDYDVTSIVYNGNNYEAVDMEAVITIGELESGDMTYVCFMEILTTDTTFFNIVFEAPIVPIDTVTFNCINLVLDDSQAMSEATIYVTASNSDYSVLGAYNANKITVPASYTGTANSGQAMAYITERATDRQIGAYATTFTLSYNSKLQTIVDMEMLGDDHILYKAKLLWYIPDPVDTAYLHFPTISKSMYYVDDLGLQDLQLANYSGDYSVSFDILYIDQIMGGEFVQNDLYMEQTFITRHTPTGDKIVEFAKFKKGEIFQKNDTTFLNAQIIGLDSIYYDIKMFYTVPTPIDTITAEFSMDNTFFTNALPQGIFILEGSDDEGMISATVQVSRIQNEKLEDTFINDGNFQRNDFDMSNTVVEVWNDATGGYDEWFVQKGELVVTVDDNKQIVAKASFICDDSKLYNLTFNALYERVHLPNDAEEGEIDYTYAADSHVTITDWIDGYGLIRLEMLPEDFSNVAAFYFNAEAMDPVIGIPAGVYPINSSFEPGTVVASKGIGMDYLPLESYFCYLYEEDGELYYDQYGLYCLVEGTVTVENVNGKIKIDVDAINSWERPVKLHYQAAGSSAVENVEADSNDVKKALINGQLIIIRNGEKFNVMGTQVK